MQWHLFLEILVVPLVVGVYSSLRGGRHIQRSEPGVIWNFDRVAAFRLGVSAYKDRRLRGSDCHYFRAPFSVELFLLFREVKPMHRLYAV